MFHFNQSLDVPKTKSWIFYMQFPPSSAMTVTRSECRALSTYDTAQHSEIAAGTGISSQFPGLRQVEIVREIDNQNPVVVINLVHSSNSWREPFSELNGPKFYSSEHA
jgi:hypothetical protein